MSTYDWTLDYHCWSPCDWSCPGHVAVIHHQDTADTFSITIDDREPMWIDLNLLPELVHFIQTYGLDRYGTAKRRE